jgi:hypothetical protein
MSPHAEEGTSPETPTSPAAPDGGPGGPTHRRRRIRALLTWFGVDPRGNILPVDRDRACAHEDCDRPVLVGEKLCPVHLGLAAPEELEVAPARIPPGTLRALLVAGLSAALGLGLAVGMEDAGFGWLGLGSAGAVLGSLAARRSNWPLLASLLGTAAFFGAAILGCAAALSAALAVLPLLL